MSQSRHQGDTERPRTKDSTPAETQQQTPDYSLVSTAIILRLQRTIGNRATVGAIQRDPTRQRAAVVDNHPIGGQRALMTPESLAERHTALVGRLERAVTTAQDAYTAVDTLLSAPQQDSVSALRQRSELLADSARDREFVLRRRQGALEVGNEYRDAAQRQNNLARASRLLDNMESFVRDVEGRAARMEQRRAQLIIQSLPDLADDKALMTPESLAERHTALVGRMERAVTTAQNAYTAVDTFLSALRKRSELLNETEVRTMRGRSFHIQNRAHQDRQLLEAFERDRDFVLMRRDRAQVFGDEYSAAQGQNNLAFASRLLDGMEQCVRAMEDRAAQMEQQRAQSTSQSRLAANLAMAGFGSLDRTSWSDIRSQASNASVEMHNRKTDVVKYFTYQQADYQNVRDMLQRARQEAVAGGLPEDVVNTIIARGRSAASDTDEAVAPTPEEAAALVPEEHQTFVYEERAVRPGLLRRRTGETQRTLRQGNARLLQQLVLFGRVKEEAQRRTDRAVLHFAFISDWAQESLSLHDEMAAQAEQPEAERMDKATAVNRVGDMWANVLIADKMRAELKRDQQRVKAESRRLNEFGERHMHWTKQIALQAVAVPMAAVVGFLTAGRQTVAADSVGADYQRRLTTENRADEIKKLVQEVSDIWNGSGFAGSGLGGAPGRRMFAIVRLIAGAAPIFRQVFSTIAGMSAFVAAILGVATVGVAAPPFVAVGTAAAAAAGVLGLVELIAKSVMLAWSAIGAIAARGGDPRARINTNSRWQKLALELGLDHVMKYAGKQMKGAQTPGARTPGAQPNAGGTFASRAWEHIRNENVLTDLAKDTKKDVIKDPVSGVLMSPPDRYQTPTQQQVDEAQGRQNAASNQQQNVVRGADKLENVGNVSEGIVANMQAGSEAAQGAAQQQEAASPSRWQRIRGYATTALSVVWEILATILIVPGLIQDIVIGIRRAVLADDKRE